MLLTVALDVGGWMIVIQPLLLLTMPGTLPTRILVTGGAGFVGANLCLAIAARSPATGGRGARLAQAPGLRGQPRPPARGRRDASSTATCASAATCSASSPSRRSSSARRSRRCWPGMGSGADFVVQTNLLGAHNCLELARRDGAQFVFVSTSRVYPVAALSQLRADRGRDALRADARSSRRPGASEHGIAEDFPLGGARTLYGATKLAAELLVTEYADAFGVRGVIDRCGVIAGPWQMGKVDQGVFTHWLLAHRLERPLTYIGYGGTGKQVRDLLHVDDLCDLLLEQLGDPARVGRRDGQRRRRGRGQPVAARDHRAVPRADRQRGRDRAGRRGAAGRRAALRVGRRGAVRAHGVAPRTCRRGRSSRTRWRGSRPTSRAVMTALG